jgi:hypothetical protein
MSDVRDETTGGSTACPGEARGGPVAVGPMRARICCDADPDADADADADADEA